jgi:hypothetical protein
VGWLNAEAAHPTREVIADQSAPPILLRNDYKMNDYDSVLTLAQKTSARFPLVGRFTVAAATVQSGVISGSASWGNLLGDDPRPISDARI